MAQRRIRVLLAPEATEVDVERMEFALDSLPHPLRHERDGHSLLIYPQTSSFRRLQRHVAAAFDELQTRSFFMPFRIEALRRGGWVDIGPGRRPKVPPPAPASDAIRWSVRARPRTAFDWREAREAVEYCGRAVIGETQHDLVVAAGDQADARVLAARLLESRAIGSVECLPLGWFARWRVRQRLLGNYAGTSDPTQFR